MSTLAIILIAAAVVIALVLIGGLAANRRRVDEGSEAYARHIAAADNALEQARAADRGWDRAMLEEAARAALAQERPDFSYDDLHLVLVDDQPGVDEDRAHFAAIGGDGETRVVLVRGVEGWGAERLE